ncbi:FAD-dependent monooxygenase [Asticcacaulis solisilvae]|uniref:FAD-dependent monooxygenase n=1 Tax=Asticcacaulis solisilvae TaxID=1217274 RepID=UPI003FD79B8D
MRTTDRHEVVIAGGGPTGLMLAGELALKGIDTVVIERRVNQDIQGARAGGLHARTLEILDQRGIADRFLAEGTTAQVAGFAGMSLDIGDFPTRHPYGLALWQKHIERILAGWVAELGVPVRRGLEVTGCAQGPDGVDVALSDGGTVRAHYLAGCDGGRSLVRKAAGIAFTGTDATVSNLIAEARLTGEPPQWGIRRDAVGIHALSREDDGTVRILVTETAIGTGEPTLAELKAALTAVFGSDFGVHAVTWLSRFSDATRQAETCRKGRVLLAGDAAHTHPPDGGQGLQLGVQDAVNLGWKLAQVVRGLSSDTLLDTYHAERHPVAARLLQNTLASVAMRPQDERTKALRDTLAWLIGMEQPRKEFAGLLSGLSLRYDLGDGHPLVGCRMPDLDLEVDGSIVRVYSLMHDAPWLFIDFGTGLAVPDRVRRIDAAYAGPWNLPVTGAVPAPGAVLVRPDGYVAWAGNTGDGLRSALAAWFEAGH